MFDYVIVGAGSAGCVLASRLSEDPHTSVLLLEAGGPDQKQEIQIPAAFSKLFKSPYDWAYQTEEQPHLNGRRLYWPRGKVLGGSSSINAMIYTRGSRHDYDRWYDLGNDGWSYAQVLPYFERAEHRERAASISSSDGGPLDVSQLRCVNPLSRAFVAAAAELGFPRNDDLSDANLEGVGFFRVTQRNGKRHSAAAAYLKPALRRRNLTVRTGIRATRVIFERTRAVGVAFVANGQSEEVRAEREVILCGGVINSPQLLMLSGVGPADHLRALDIPVVADLPGVGRNLQDHLAVVVAHECIRPVSMASAETIGNILKFLLFRTGPLTSNVAEAGAFVRVNSDRAAPDLELIFGPVFYINHGFDNPEGHGFSIGAVLQHPDSLGQIMLRSSDPFEAPSIQPNYLAAESDRRTLVQGLQLARRLAGAKAFEAYRGAEYWPGPRVQTDEQILEAIRQGAQTLYHPVGTCKMGKDSLAVVDARLRVHGLEGLRVVDASVMPTIISGHANGPTIMIAEKAADMIKRGTPGPAIGRQADRSQAGDRAARGLL